MAIPKDLELSIQKRTTALGIADTLAVLSPQSTLSPAALERAGLTLARAGTRALGEHSPSATDALPRISVDNRIDAPETALPPTDTADLCVLGLLGEGGMGRVLRARQASLGREVALKMLRSDDHSKSHQASLLREARLTGALEHPGIVPVHLLGLSHTGEALMVMKRIEGVSFQRLLDEPDHPGWEPLLAARPDRLEAMLEILMQVCQSLAFAHDRGILHRDIKPENVMVGRYGEVYLVDWGVAATIEEAQSSEGIIVGTPAYMAPEMLMGGAMDARTDVYLLAATLHHLLTGRPRHEGTNMMQVFASIALSKPFSYPESVPSMLGDLCNRATSPDPDARPASAFDFRKELSAYLRYRSAMALCETAQERVQALEQALSAAGNDGVPPDLAGLYRKATEARFGFAESLRAHPSLEAAQAGLWRTLRAVFDLELRQKHLESASAFLEEFPEPPADLLARLEQAKKEESAQRREEKRLKDLARDHDPTVEAKPRQRILGVLIATAFILTLSIFARGGANNISPQGTVMAGLFMTTMTAIAVGVAWRKMSTLFNRRIGLGLLLVTGFMVLHRILAWQSGQDTATILRDDTFLLAAMISVAGVLFERKLLYMTGLIAVMHILMRLRPNWTSALFNALAICAVLGFLWLWRETREHGEKKALKPERDPPKSRPAA